MSNMLGKVEDMKNTLKISGIALLALFLMIGGSMSAMADVESNNSFETVEAIGEGTYTGTVNFTDDTDYYQISIPAHMMVMIIVTAGYNDSLDVTLYDQNRTMVDYGYPSDGASTTLSYDPAGSAEQVYLKIEGSDMSEGNYTVQVTFSDSALEGLLEGLNNAATTLAWVCVAGVVIVVLIVVVIAVVLLKKRKGNTPPPYQVPAQPRPNQGPPQYPPYPQVPSQSDQQPSKNSPYKEK